MRLRKNPHIKTNNNENSINFCNTLIVGLGNPGYNWTRHNVGSDLLNIIMQKHKYKEIKKNLYIVFFNGFCAFVYLSPDLMNISGDNIIKEYKYLNCKNLIILADDLDTDLGKIKKSFAVSSGGHNGIKSVINNLGHNRFWKIKIGIGRPILNAKDISTFVLERFEKEEKDLLLSLVDNIESNLNNIIDEINQ